MQSSKGKKVPLHLENKSQVLALFLNRTVCKK